MQQSQNPKPVERRPSAKVLPFLIKAQEQQKQQNFQSAVELYTQAIATDPRDPFAYSFRGMLDLKYLHNWERALNDFTKAIQYWDRFPRVYLYRGICRLNVQDLSGSIEDFQKAARINPNDVDLYVNWAKSLQFLGEYGKGEQVLTDGLKRFPKDVLLYRERGTIRLSIGRNNDAVDDFTNALALNPNEVYARNNRALMYRVLGNLTGAVSDLTYLINNGHGTALTYFNRSCMFLAMGNALECIADGERTLQLDSNYHGVRLVMAMAYRNSGQLHRSLKETSTILQRNPQENAAFSNILGIVNAVDKSKYAIAMEAYFSRANTRLLLGDTVGALADVDKAYLFERSNKKIPTAEVNLFVNARQEYKQRQIFLPDNSFPATLQLFPRNAHDSATINIRGQIQRVNGQEFDSVYVELFKNNKLQQRYSIPLRYESSTSTVAIDLGLRAECSLYAFHIGVKSGYRNNTFKCDTILLRRDSIVCGDAFLVAGQSNVVLGSLTSTRHNTFIRTFSSGVSDSYWGLAAANNNTNDYNVGAAALQMAEEYVSEHKVPVAIIHGGLSGSFIEIHLPQSASSERLDNSSWYGHIFRYAQLSGLQKSFRAALWYHGEANTDQDYFDKFATLLHYWQQDYPSLSKIYAVQVRPARCGQVGQISLREQQRRFKEINPTITLHASAGVQGFDNCHYSNAGYSDLGKQFARLLARDFYAAADTIGIASPMIVRALWTGADRKEIALEFDTNDSLIISPDIQVSGILQTLARSAFLLDGKQIPALSVRTTQNRVFITFTNAVTAQTISYIPDKFYTTAPEDVYSGPWLFTRRGVGALTFHNVPIQTLR